MGICTSTLMQNQISRKSSAPLVLFLCLLYSVPFATSQTPAKPKFDVVSVKTTKAGSGPAIRMQANGGRLIANNVTVKMLMQRAYSADSTGLFPNQMIGGASWIETDRFDVEGKLDGDSRSVSQQQTWVMVQSLLEDRFRLKTHHDMRELPVYSLLLGKNGSKLTRSEDQAPPNPAISLGPAPAYDPKQPLPRGAFTAGGTEVTTVAGNAVPLSRLASALQTWMQRPVVNNTGLAGLFDFKFSFTTPCGIIFPCAPTDPTPIGPSLSSALDELGLRLESTKALVDVLVIDSVERPSEN
jgi:uncharacterized protein (TIGR03435 family)